MRAYTHAGGPCFRVKEDYHYDMFNPSELLKRLSPPTCPEAQKKTCVIGLLWLVCLLVYTLLVVPGCYISWNNGMLEIGEGQKPLIIQQPATPQPGVPK